MALFSAYPGRATPLVRTSSGTRCTPLLSPLARSAGPMAGRAWPAGHAIASSPLCLTMDKSLTAAPVGRRSPRSHCDTNLVGTLR